MQRIGFIGLGIMGSGMVANLLKSGYSVKVWNRTPEKANHLLKLGAKWVDKPEEVAIETDVIWTMLSADEQVKNIMQFIFPKTNNTQIVIDSSTVSPETSRMLYSLFLEKDVNFLDVPVTGSAPDAAAGNLGFMVGGQKEAFEKCIDLFRVLGKSWVYLVESGNGSTVKIASNTMVAISLLSLCEGLSITAKSGIDPEDFIRVISNGGAHNRMVDAKSQKMLDSDLNTQFSASLMNKDLGLASRMANDLGVVTPALSLAKQLMQMTVNSGFGEKDVSSIFQLYKEWSK